ncbi:S41 family peptidase [Lysobacter hankyongensis]|uniref:Tricorn protease homolog n=1 Tax=Lysobacter hankyongensis TaxID=1176535 RepID=A0ABP9AJ36_9GAMM
MKHPNSVILSLAIAALLPAADAGAATRLLRFPDVCGDNIVFTYAGDLWTASTSGGRAQRLTAAAGLEQSAKYSPDCSRIAFTGQYGGGDQVYVVDAQGGEPRQLTFYPSTGPLPQRWGFDHHVNDWTPDGKAVLYRSWQQSSALQKPHLYTVPVSGGLPTRLPMDQAGSGRFSPDGTKLVYSPKYHDFRTWNRYSAGWAQDLYLYDIASKTARNITGHAFSDRDPIWNRNGIYFLSDRDNYMNLYRYDIADGTTTQLTRRKGADARWASGDIEGRIVYEVDGEIHLYDTARGTERRVAIDVPAELVRARAEERSVADRIESSAISGDGRRVLYVARGEIFSVSATDGFARNLTHTPGVHEREASWSKDGRHVVYVSDQGGEEAVWISDAAGGNRRQITTANHGRLYAPKLSPDGKRIAFADSGLRLQIVDVASGRVQTVARDATFPRQDYAWSPGGRYLAYATLSEDGQRPQLRVHDTVDQRSRTLVSEFVDGFLPAFSPDGEYLYFVGNREWVPQLSSIEWNYATDRTSGIFGIALRANAANPVGPRDVAAEPAESGDTQTAKHASDSIDFAGIADRVFRVPVENANIDRLFVNERGLVYVVSGSKYYGRDPSHPNRLMAYALSEGKETMLREGVDNVSVSADGKWLHGGSGSDYKRIDLMSGGEPLAVSTAGLQALVDPRAEYVEVFNESWRRMRDHFYAANMHGYDWNALRRKYEALLPHVGDRSDLNYLLGQMAAELSASHTYASGGDLGIPDAPNVALLGAEFELDAARGAYRIARILRGRNDEEKYRSPLTEVGVNVREGDYLLAINGRKLTADDNPYRLLRAPAGQPVELTVNRTASDVGARKVLVRPIASEQALYYHQMVESKRAIVDQASGGRIGYLHLPDMEDGGIREFIKWFYPQMRKQGLIVDVRDNMGGNVSPMVLERLMRKPLAVQYERGSTHVGTYPAQSFVGHTAALINGTTASDGDQFAYAYKVSGLGPMIGTKTWGGVVGFNDWGPVIDGGDVKVPQFAPGDLAGAYVVEGEGVSPDIVLEADVGDLISGRDTQLLRAIAELETTLAREPVRLPPMPADPIKAPEEMRAVPAEPR